MVEEEAPDVSAYPASDPREHETCYIFSPPDADRKDGIDRPSKRRKVSDRVSTDPGSDELRDQHGFRPLLGGDESHDFMSLRYETYKKLWSAQEERIETILESVNARTIDNVTDFIRTATPAKYDGKIPTGLVLAGPSIASHGALFRQMAAHIKTETGGPVVILKSTEANNLKTILKRLIRSATTQRSISEAEEEEDAGQEKGSKLLNYDLQILHNYVRRHHSSKVVVALQDSEAFDGHLLAELVTLFKAWLDRIPFVLLFGIATSVEIFHEKLSSSAVRCMQGETFDVERAEESLERVFDDCVRPSSTIRLGPMLSAMLLYRQRDHVQSIQAFVSTLKYAYMSHFYANALSVLLVEDASALADLQPEHVEAIRHLPSFRKHVQRTMDEGDTRTVRLLLTDDAFLLKTAIEHRQLCRETTLGMLTAMDLIYHGSICINPKFDLSRSDLYVQAVAGDLEGGVIVRDLLLSIQKLSSDKLEWVLEKMTGTCKDAAVLERLSDIQSALRVLTESVENKGAPLRSEHDLRHDTLRTTVVAQKVEISKQKAALSKHDSAYSKLVHQLHEALRDYFDKYLVDPQHIFLSEVYFYDLRSPHRDVFMPRPRHAIERALRSPHDYLGCSCCSASVDGLSSTQPATAILYQLYLESGALINVFDLWSAFYAIVGGEKGEDCGEANALALFYRALADLKFLGMIKHSKKKIDHMAKLAWKGL